VLNEGKTEKKKGEKKIRQGEKEKKEKEVKTNKET
jgi:hypothetical protein